jgi:hypothetical protein
MKIKFLRNVAVYSQHRELGSVHEVEDREAEQLITDGAAIPAAAEIETATAKPGTKETAAKR